MYVYVSSLYMTYYFRSQENSMARSSGRAKPYVVEIQRHYYLDEFDRKEKKGQHIRPPVAPRNPSIPPQLRSSGRRPHKEWASKPRHVPLDPSRLNRGSLEYEDIYNQRNRSGENPHLKQQGRWSFRDDRGYGRVREYTRRSPGIARPTEMTLMNGKTIDRGDNTEKRQQNGIVSDTSHMRAHYKEAHVSTSRDAPSHEQSRVTKDKNDDHRDDLELWIARQTSFPKKQDGMVEMSNQRIVGNSTHDLVSNQSDPKQSNSNQSSSVHEKSGNFLLPSVALKPGRPHTPRSASPALSVRSSQSGASHVSHHSARSGTSEVSVVSSVEICFF